VGDGDDRAGRRAGAHAGRHGGLGQPVELGRRLVQEQHVRGAQQGHYFPERSDLLAAISADVLDKVETATERARLDDGPAAKALERLCQEYFELGDGLTLMFDTPQLTNWSDWDEETPADLHFLRTVRRGHAEGSIDAELHEEWVRNLVWALLYTAWEHTRTTPAPPNTRP
jgi:AcrR family transcriptional regulator